MQKNLLRSREWKSGICDKLREFSFTTLPPSMLLFVREECETPFSDPRNVNLSRRFARPRRRKEDDGSSGREGMGGIRLSGGAAALCYSPSLLSKKFRTSDQCSHWESRLPNWGTALIAHSGGSVFKQLCEQFQSSFCLLVLPPRAQTRIVSSPDSMNCKRIFLARKNEACNHY